MNRRDTSRVVIIVVRTRTYGRQILSSDRHGPCIPTRFGWRIVSNPYAHLPHFDRTGTIHSACILLSNMGTIVSAKRSARDLFAERGAMAGCSVQRWSLPLGRWWGVAVYLHVFFVLSA